MLNYKISVVIPYYNREDTIKQAIESVQRQSLEPMEIIIVDDGSSEESREKLKVITDGVNGLKLICQTNSGAACARNSGINVAQGDYIAFLDSDDVWSPDHLALSCVSLSSREDAVISHARFKYTLDQDASYERASQLNARVEKIFSKWIENGKIFRENTYLLSSNKACEILIAENAGFSMSSIVLAASRLHKQKILFDPNVIFAEDVDFFVGISCLGSVVYIDRITSMYKLHSGNTVSLGLVKHCVPVEKLIQRQRSLEKRLMYHSDACVKWRLLSILAERYFLIAQELSTAESYGDALPWYWLSFRLKPTLKSFRHVAAQKILPKILLKKLYS